MSEIPQGSTENQAGSQLEAETGELNPKSSRFIYPERLAADLKTALSLSGAATVTLSLDAFINLDLPQRFSMLPEAIRNSIRSELMAHVGGIQEELKAEGITLVLSDEDQGEGSKGVSIAITSQEKDQRILIEGMQKAEQSFLRGVDEDFIASLSLGEPLSINHFLEIAGIHAQFSKLPVSMRTRLGTLFGNRAQEIIRANGLTISARVSLDKNGIYSDIEFQLTGENEASELVEQKRPEYISNKDIEFSFGYECLTCGQKVKPVSAVYQGKKPVVTGGKKGKPFRVDFDMLIEHCKDSNKQPAWVQMTHRFEAPTKAEVEKYIESLKAK